MKMKIPNRVNFIIEKLNNAGYEAYVVGGCVRDIILDREPMDWDLTTSALPEQIKEVFEKTIDTGIQHGTVTVMVEHEGFEVTTYRIDGEYEDCRRPKEVFFTRNIVEDLQRRDFTINAMAYHPEKGLVDPFKGQEDLEKELIRCVGVPNHRFDEDALRMLRAVRFSAKLNFTIDNETEKSIMKKASHIQHVSGERIREELNKLLVSSYPDRFNKLKELGLLDYVMPEFVPCYATMQNTPYHAYDVATHIIETVKAVEPRCHLRWTMLMHDIGKAYTRSTDENGIDHFYGHDEESVKLASQIMKRLKFDNKTMKTVTHLVKHHDYRFEPEGLEVRKAMALIGKEYFEDFLKVQLADAKGQDPKNLPARQKVIEDIEKIYRETLEKGYCTTIKELAISGNDLLELGVPRGKEVGQLLEKLRDAVIEKPELNKREHLIELVKRSL